MTLDLKDKKILHELDLDARQSFKQLGKRVGLSKEVVTYRVNKMAKDGIIHDFYTRINFAAVGSLVFRTFLGLYNLSEEKRSELINYLLSNKKIGWCVLVDGPWEVNFMYWAESTQDFESFFREFMAKFGDNVEKKWISLYGRYTNYPKTFFVKNKRGEEEKGFVMGDGQKEDLDEKDLQIITALSQNARIECATIAKQIGLNPKTISERIKQFEKKGIIKGYGISLDLQKISYMYYKLHLNFKKFDTKRFNALKEYARRNANVIYTNEFINGADFELDIYIENSEKYHKLLDEIRLSFSDIIKNFETMQYYKEFRHNLFPRQI